MEINTVVHVGLDYVELSCLKCAKRLASCSMQRTGCHIKINPNKTKIFSKATFCILLFISTFNVKVFVYEMCKFHHDIRLREN